MKIVGYVRGGVPKRSTGADCKSAGLAFVGSNPTPSTICNGELHGGKRLKKCNINCRINELVVMSNEKK